MADEIIENNEEAAGAAQAAGDSATEGNAVVTPKTEAGAAPETEAEAEAEVAIATAVAQTPAKLIQPDVGFVREIIKGGGTDMKKCMQCASCSVACNVTPDDTPFPRKEMQWAQWGLKDKLMGNPDIWLCHQCNDCTAQCPRDAKPGSVMQAIAKMTISRFSSPGFLAKGVGSPSALLLMAAIPVIILAVIIGAFGDYTPERGELINGVLEHKDQIVYSRMMPILAIDLTYSAFFFLAIGVFALGVKNYWGLMSKTASAEGVKMSGSGLGHLGPVLSEIITHKRFGKCDENEDRKIAHLFIFYGFLLLFVATATSVGFHYLLHKYSPYDQISPVKFFGNTGAIAGILGIGLITINRFKHADKAGVGSYYDWLLIGVIMVIMVTGLGAELLRLGNMGVIAFPTYFVHLSAVLFLFVYAPFSKMAHMVYRTTALAFARVTGRDTGIEA